LTEKPQNPPIKVKMKIDDIEFEIEAQEDQLQTAVDRILATVTERMKETLGRKLLQHPKKFRHGA
jgi:hypothetical protein